MDTKIESSFVEVRKNFGNVNGYATTRPPAAIAAMALA